MAAIEFRVRTEVLGGRRLVTVAPFVGGLSLVELPGRVEVAPATEWGEPALAGS